MSATAAQDPADRMPASFEEFRDLWEAQDAKTRWARLLQRMVLRLLNALVALLADARARRLEGADGGEDAEPDAAHAGVADVKHAGVPAARVDDDAGGRNDAPELARETAAPRMPVARACEQTPAPAACDAHEPPAIAADGPTGALALAPAVTTPLATLIAQVAPRLPLTPRVKPGGKPLFSRKGRGIARSRSPIFSVFKKCASAEVGYCVEIVAIS